MKVSLIATVLNEGKSIKAFLDSVFKQSKKPDELIIVDGGSTDNTISEISNFKINDKKLRIKLIFKKGNRSVGRNEAIRRASCEIIASTDAGCSLDKDWIENIVKPFRKPDVDVVAGYYKGQAENIFQKCLTPYVLVMPDKVDSNFLPATRSMAFKKSIWEKIGGFNEKYSHNEDYVFANKLKDSGAKIIFEKKAIVNWKPLSGLRESFRMFFRFALGDSESGILRPKVFLIFVRYFLFFYLLLLSYIEKSFIPLYADLIGLVLYAGWSIKKNYLYVKDLRANFILPLLQFVSDFAVLSGTSVGLVKRISFKKLIILIKNYKWVSLLVIIYIVGMLSVINWGIPSENHPFNYFMDEWHQAQAVRAVFTHGSPNIPGAANGSMFHFLLSGLLLAPFVLTGFINPFAIKSSVENPEIQQRMFELLRLNTLLFGVASVILVAYIAKKYFKINPFIVTLLFIVNPIWISLSNYFKYDIALIFWILCSILLLFRYSTKPTFLNLALFSFVSGIALSVKISALPLMPLIIVSCIIFAKKSKAKQIAFGSLVFILSFLFFGIPDLILGKGNISEYLYDNLIRTPGYSSNYFLGAPFWIYQVFKGVPALFGNFLTTLSFFGLGYLVFKIFTKSKFSDKGNYIILLISFFLFVFSLIPLKIEARGNRLLVLLPFIVFFGGVLIEKIFYIAKKKLRLTLVIVLLALFILQSVETFSWLNIKYGSEIRKVSSEWIRENIPVGSKIGLENIPIYQSLPDIILKDYYSNKKVYEYEIVGDVYGRSLDYLILTNREIAYYMVNSPKKDFIWSINLAKYKEVFSMKRDLKLLNFFRSDLDYYFSGLIQQPLSVMVYRRI